MKEDGKGWRGMEMVPTGVCIHLFKPGGLID